VVVMVTDGELERLLRLARDRGLPMGTVAYRLFAPALRRAK
jgi:hypothetical protein